MFFVAWINIKTNNSINLFLKVPLDQFLPNSKKTVKVTKVKDNKAKKQQKKDAKLKRKEEARKKLDEEK